MNARRQWGQNKNALGIAFGKGAGLGWGTGAVCPHHDRARKRRLPVTVQNDAGDQNRSRRQQSNTRRFQHHLCPARDTGIERKRHHKVQGGPQRTIQRLPQRGQVCTGKVSRKRNLKRDQTRSQRLQCGC